MFSTGGACDHGPPSPQVDGGAADEGTIVITPDGQVRIPPYLTIGIDLTPETPGVFEVTGGNTASVDQYIESGGTLDCNNGTLEYDVWNQYEDAMDGSVGSDESQKWCFTE